MNSMHAHALEANQRAEHTVRSCVLDRRGLASISHAARMGHAGSAPPM